MRLLASPANSS
jgi:hypothetical protein